VLTQTPLLLCGCCCTAAAVWLLLNLRCCRWQLQDLPLSCGVGSFLLARAATEMLCEALAAAWLSGSVAPLRRLMLVPTAGAAEQAVSFRVVLPACKPL
jgi:hypothetical protein